MEQRKKNRKKALIIGVIILIAVLITVHVFGNYIIPWIISLHG